MHASLWTGMCRYMFWFLHIRSFYFCVDPKTMKDPLNIFRAFISQYSSPYLNVFQYEKKCCVSVLFKVKKYLSVLTFTPF